MSLQRLGKLKHFKCIEVINLCLCFKKWNTILENRSSGILIKTGSYQLLVVYTYGKKNKGKI